MNDPVREKFEAAFAEYTASITDDKRRLKRNVSAEDFFAGCTAGHAQGQADMREEAPKKKYTKNLWSLLRNLLSQGAAIHKDYDSGNFGSYEMFSAKLDEVARDKEDEIMELLALGKEQQS